ncbi:MAG: RagB/SusD family nutrient uptake outer membrane protein [Prevotella sp.]|nr:RagB/SusD family nutrient uptake outer membrane protein [Prevotella sp.]
MITKNIKNIARKLVVGCGCAATIVGLASCSDFFDILPMNDVVLENYWTEKDDVSSVRNSCYESLISTDAMTRLGVWGEVRSDNLKAGANVPNDINEILKENLLSSNPYTKWAKIYECINRCNTVCHYAPIVQSIDPNYSESDMKADVAEVSALRALCYFTLIRTFRDVPYTREPSIEDGQNYILPATPFNDVLDSLITDLENVKDDAVRRYELERVSGAYYSLPAINSSRITRVAIYALLSDLYLWKQDWNNAIKYADMVIDFKRQQYDELKSRVGDITEIGLIDGVPLYLECPDGSGNVGGNSYNAIFGEGNSFESLFELYFSRSQGQENSWVRDYYGSENTPNGRLRGNELAFGTSLLDVIQNKVTLFKSTDGRYYENFRVQGTSLGVGKYFNSSVSYNTKSVSSEQSLNLRQTARGSNTAPWIFYRLTEVLLIKAEALACRNQEGDLEAAFNMVNIVNKRANNLTQSLKKDDYISSQNEMLKLVLDERRREFMFEGKRWFDLVRRSRLDGNTAYLVSCVKSLYPPEQANAISIKMADMNIIYFPYNRDEMKVNPLLKQNSAYNNGEDQEYSR